MWLSFCVGNTGLITYRGVNVPSFKLDLEGSHRVKIVGVDMI